MTGKEIVKIIMEHQNVSNDGLVFQNRIPYALHNGWKCTVGFSEILKIVNNDDGFCFEFGSHDCLKYSVPVGYRYVAEQIAVNKFCCFFLVLFSRHKWC